MLYNSWSFAVFFLVVFVIYWLLPHKCRWVMLLVSNYYFYMRWSIKWGLLLLAVTAASYLMALLIQKTDSLVSRKVFLIMFLLGVLGLLFFVKYVDFLGDSIEKLFNLLTVPISVSRFNIVFPIGLSFILFRRLVMWWMYTGKK